MEASFFIYLSGETETVIIYPTRLEIVIKKSGHLVW